MSSLIQVNFRNDVVYAIKQNDEVFVALKPICENLGLDWSSQLRNIKADEILSSTMGVMTTVAEDGKNRDMVVLPLTFLNGWLFKVETSRIQNEQVKQRVIEYQKECYKVLYNHFNKKSNTELTRMDLIKLALEAEEENQKLKFEVTEKEKMLLEVKKEIKEKDSLITTYKDLLSTDNLLSLKDAFHILKIKDKVGFETLRTKGVLMQTKKSIRAMSTYITRKYFKDVPTAYLKTDGTKEINYYSKLTPLGFLWLIEKRDVIFPIDSFKEDFYISEETKNEISKLLKQATKEDQRFFALQITQSKLEVING